MTGPLPGSPAPEPPPEVPEEFAAAYRAAYARALAAQSTGPAHREEPGAGQSPEGGDTEELPRRRGPIRIGTHRTQLTDPRPDNAQPAGREPDSPEPSTRRGVTESPWFVPLLLALLALLLIFGAYTLGRTFSGHVSGDDTPRPSPSVVMGDGAPGGLE